MALYAKFSSQTANGYRKILLALSPFDEETSQNVVSPYELTKFQLDLFGESFDNLDEMIGDNCSTNHAFSDLARTSFIGCASHRLNLAVLDILKQHSRLIKQVRIIMKRLRTPIGAAKLRQRTPLKVLLSNGTRRSTAFIMLSRYKRIHGYLDELDLPNLKPLLLNTTDDNLISALCTQLADLDTVPKSLQSDSCTMTEKRALFDEVIKTILLLRNI